MNIQMNEFHGVGIRDIYLPTYLFIYFPPIYVPTYYVPTYLFTYIFIYILHNEIRIFKIIGR